MKKLRSVGLIFSGFLVVLALAGVVWLTEQTNSKQYAINLATYEFKVFAHGDTLRASDDENHKGVEFTAEHAAHLQKEGVAAWPVNVQAGADRGIDLDYLMFFDPFYTESVWGAADITVASVSSPEMCSTNIDVSADDANMFYEQKEILAEGADNLTTYYYCVVAAAPQDPEKLDIFTNADPGSEESPTLNVRYTAQ